MKNLQKITWIALFMTSIIQFSCSDNNEVVVAPTLQNIPFIEIGKGYMFTPTEALEQNTIVTNQTQWNNLIIQMNSNSNVSSAFTTTGINFSTECLIVVIDMVRPHTGFIINIDAITENPNNLVVSKSLTSSLNGYATTTRPFHIVKIPIQTKPIIFR